MKFLKSRAFKVLVIVIILISIIIISSNPGSPIHVVYKVISVPLAPVERFLTKTAGKISDTVNYFMNSETIQQEYDRCKEENDKLKEQIRNLEKYKTENEELRELLNFKEVYKEYNYIAANVIAHDVSNWYKVFSIDKGSADGVGLYDPIVTSKGLVGKVIAIAPHSAKVMTIIDESSTVMARMTKSKDLVRVRGSSSLQNDGLCQMDRISELADISIGDTIETAESGGIYPKGIIIGTVKEVKQVTGETSRYAIIDPAVDFRTVEKVIVLGSKSENDKKTIGDEQ